MRRTLLLLVALFLPLRFAVAETIEVRAYPVPLNPRDEGETRAGSLEYLAGFALASSDTRWGGFSSMILATTGDALVAVADQGHWLTLDLVHDAAGRLTGVGGAEMGPLLGPGGVALDGKGAADAEGMTLGPDGGLLVSFERDHRIWRYGGSGAGGAEAFAATPAAFPAPKAIVMLPGNSGLETIATLADGRVLALAEGAEAAAGDIPGWLLQDGRWEPLAWTRTAPYRPTDAAVLPDGDLLVLERRYTAARGPGMRLSVVAAGSIVAGAHLAGAELTQLGMPRSVDNFEGVAARAAPGGGMLIYILSDDNTNLLQRTLLLQFLWRP
jgi:hypothetical protein